MYVDRTTMRYAHKAIRTAVSEFLFTRNANLIDFGYKIKDGQILTDQLAIRLHVYQKKSDLQLQTSDEPSFPRQLEGFQTDVIENKLFYRNATLGFPAISRGRNIRTDPLCGGISISSERHYNYGTLGCLVRDRQTGEEMILSNWHVLVGDWGAREGTRIYQPGRRDGGLQPDTIANLKRNAMSANYDAAVATLNGNRPIVNQQVGIGPIRGIAKAEFGDRVIKSGRQSEVTRGVVTGTGGVAHLPYGYVYRMIRDVITISPPNMFGNVSDGGDSGSIWIKENSMEAVGLHFAGTMIPESANAMDIQAVLDALGIDLVTEETRTQLQFQTFSLGQRQLVRA